MNNDDQQSTDDALEPKDTGLFDPSRDEEKVESDGDTPASPASDVPNHMNPTDPQTDSDLDAQELYDEGLDGATGANETEEKSHDGPRPMDWDKS